MAAVRRSRGCYTGAVTKAFDKLTLLNSTDVAAITTFNAPDLSRQLTSLERTASNFLITMEEAQLFAPEDATEEEAFQTDEIAILETFEEAVARVRLLAEHLLALKSVQTGLTDLTFDIQSLETSLRDRPDSDHSHCFSSIEACPGKKSWMPEHCLQTQNKTTTHHSHQLSQPILHALHRPLTVNVFMCNP